jgi:MFS family permease
VVFVVIYGLDWVATVPPTIALCREVFGGNGSVVFGWVFAAHQVGAAISAFGAGYVHDRTGSYTVAWSCRGSVRCGSIGQSRNAPQNQRARRRPRLNPDKESIRT